MTKWLGNGMDSSRVEGRDESISIFLTLTPDQSQFSSAPFSSVENGNIFIKGYFYFVVNNINT